MAERMATSSDPPLAEGGADGGEEGGASDHRLRFLLLLVSCCEAEDPGASYRNKVMQLCFKVNSTQLLTLLVAHTQTSAWVL